MASNLERARAMLTGKVAPPSTPTAVSVSQPLESETVKLAENECVSAFCEWEGHTDLAALDADFVSLETIGETETETLKQAATVAIPDDERKAIMLCSGMPSTWAAVFSALDADRPPQGLSVRLWQDRLDAILVFADQYASHLDGLGWDAGALFGIGEHWQELHHRGHGWFIAEVLADGGKVEALNERSIVHRTNRGAMRTIWNENIAPV